MTDKTDSKEREALVAYLKDCDAHDIVPDVGGAWHAAFQAGRASLAASAGSELVEFQLPPTPFKSFAPGVEIGYDLFGGADIRLGGEFVYVHINYDWRYTHNAARMVLAEQIAGILSGALVTHPSPPEGMVGGWIALPGTLPEPGTPVLLDIGKKYPIRAMWAAKHTVQAADDDTDWGEYVEADDMYYAPEGWYEWNECEDNHWRVTATPRAWAPLPPTTSAGSGKGE
ncbi:hypothetical protein LJR074_003244 [Acidovorax sp. LjRoot74]|uniref:hypothetical protein n=1 Tax=Acidovorax sp. LjRoot74 TaxID=3342337 RepID=UPI003ECF6197